MRITDMNWMQVEVYLQNDDRCVLPLGSTEQHAYLSLSVDSILAEKMALDAAEPLGIPAFPVLHYGLTPYFRAYPGTITLRLNTYLGIIRDILDSMAEQGFRRIVIVNGHGGNSPAQAFASEWISDNPGVRVKFHNWWNATSTWAKTLETDAQASHASWSENFPWTRLADVAMPETQKAMIDFDLMRILSPVELRDYLGDGNFGGLYRRSDDEMHAIWDVAVEETRALLTGKWSRE
jgi:creatinine amidohydrolase